MPKLIIQLARRPGCMGMRPQSHETEDKNETLKYGLKAKMASIT